MAAIDERKLFFLRGVLAALASNGQLVHYDEVRRLCRLNKQMMARYLGAARKPQHSDEPDFCSIVVNSSGEPGDGWWRDDVAAWAAEARRAHVYWASRRRLDNPQFRAKHKRLPTLPGRSQKP